MQLKESAVLETELQFNLHILLKQWVEEIEDEFTQLKSLQPDFRPEMECKSDNSPEMEFGSDGVPTNRNSETGLTIPNNQVTFKN